jgi:hypothetical protein
MKNLLTIGIFLTGLFAYELSEAQQRNIQFSQQFRLAEGIVRIAEPGEISNLVNLWGDVNAPGRYLVPRGTTVHELISYARGPATFRTGETTLDWSKLRIEVHVSRYNSNNSSEEVYNFRYRYNEQIPAGMRRFAVQEDDVISLEVKRRPNLTDYLRVIGPIASIAATTLLVIDRL